MIAPVEIALAQRNDASRIALYSRDLIEYGLGWGWTPSRVLRAITAKDMNVAVASEGGRLVGFGIMRYRDEEAHLLLLGVATDRQRKGVGSALMAWFERIALDAGIGVIRLEARKSNESGLAFYRRLGYQEVMLARGMYARDEDGVRFAKDLWAG